MAGDPSGSFPSFKFLEAFEFAILEVNVEVLLLQCDRPLYKLIFSS